MLPCPHHLTGGLSHAPKVFRPQVCAYFYGPTPCMPQFTLASPPYLNRERRAFFKSSFKRVPSFSTPYHKDGNQIISYFYKYFIQVSTSLRGKLALSPEAERSTLRGKLRPRKRKRAKLAMRGTKTAWAAGGFGAATPSESPDVSGLKRRRGASEHELAAGKGRHSF